ncbi:unnamed protein product [Mycena citricolor]|uniref:Uncharacterized protein n=1 Tax=Mycena citricolor TaxID=2018698 RepID=A0AAD2Q560_9AGAR|nr:unnamed protein product [Mycena citricolor]CAK5275382.1 unnamed protein product [Mycena citricolor]
MLRAAQGTSKTHVLLAASAKPLHAVRAQQTWDEMTHIFTRCGHAISLVDEEIKCDLVRCKFSPAHPKGCTGQACMRTCWQYNIVSAIAEQIADLTGCLAPHLKKRCESCK